MLNTIIMQNQRKTFGRNGVIALVLALILGGGVYTASHGPDQMLHLSRTIPTELSPERLTRNISATSRWPQWFYSLSEVTGELKKGSVLLLKIDPQKGLHKKFELKARVEEYEENDQKHILQLKIIQDSSERLTRLFDDLDWKIEILPHGTGSLIQGTVTAHTCHWKSRLFGQFAEKILLNQIFYPNLIQLSELRQPFSLDPAPHLPPSSI